MRLETAVQRCGLTIQWANPLGFNLWVSGLFSALAFKKIFYRKLYQNIFSSLLISSLLIFMAFHPACLRAATALFIKELSSQRKFFWSPLQIAVFSGFACLSIDPGLAQSFSLIIGWLAAVCFAFFMKYRTTVKLLAVSICIFPVLMNFSVPHPVLYLFFSILSRPILFLLFPITIFVCAFPFYISLLDSFWSCVYKFASQTDKVFLPIHLAAKLPMMGIWAYLNVIMALFLYLENKRLKGL